MMEYEHEPIRGLPGELPKGEQMLWQGAPDWWALARSVFHVRIIAAYFAAIMIWKWIAVGQTNGFLAGLSAASWLAAMGFAAIVILCLLAYAIARTTLYTITNRRVVIRFGIAVPMAVNLPMKRIEGVSMRDNSDGTGNLALDIGEKPQLGYFMMWPHARPYWLSRTQPTLRGIPDVQRVAAMLREPLSRTLIEQVEMVEAPAPAAIEAAIRTARPAPKPIPELNAPGIIRA